MINPWMIFGGLIIVISSYFYGYSTGSDVVKSEWESEKAIATKQALDQVIAANEKVRLLEHKLADSQNKVEKVYVDKIKTVEIDRNILSDINKSDGLFINASCPDNSNTVSSTSSSSSVNNGEQRARLSKEAAESLISIAAEADAIAHQLKACQQILRDEREL